MNNNFNNFRGLQITDKKAADKQATRFIYEGSMATTITCNNRKYHAGFVYSNKQEEQDTAYLYLEKPNSLEIGSVFEWDQNHYLIYKVDKIVKKVLYNKYFCFECNTEIDGVYGYLRGPKTNYINTQLSMQVTEISLAKPVLVLGADIFEIGDIFKTSNRVWRVIEKDNYSSGNSLTYYSLEAFTEIKVSNEEPQNEPEPDEDIHVRAGETITLNTEGGYFTSDIEVKPTITRTTVTFTVPYTCSTIKIAYKTNGEIHEATYKVD